MPLSVYIMPSYMSPIAIVLVSLHTAALLPPRSSGEGGSVLCLWDLCWPDLPAVSVWPALHGGEGRQGAGDGAGGGAEGQPQTAPGAHGGPL